MFQNGQRLQFGEVVQAAGGNRIAVKSALNKLRAKGLVEMHNGFYQPKKQKPQPAS